MTPYSDGHHQLLLIEDDVADAELIRGLLASSKVRREEVVHVLSLEDALTSLRSKAVDVVLLDLGLPDGIGVECVDAVRAGAGEVPIVVLTGSDDRDMALSCIRAGAQDYLSKHEVQAQSLRRAIRYAIARVREHRAERRADELRLRLATVVQASPDAIISMDVDGCVTTWNPSAERIFGYSMEEAMGRPVDEIIRPAEGDDTESVAPTVFPSPHNGAPFGADDVLLCRRDGTEVSLSVAVTHLHADDGAIVGVAAFCRDTTEIKRRNDALRQRHLELMERERQMRALTSRLTEVREDERSRIAQRAHDELGQLLTGAKTDLEWMQQSLTPETLPAVAQRIVETEALVDRAIRTAQQIATELRPGALDALGLASAVRDEARRFESRAGVRTRVRIQAVSDPPSKLATALFRVLQELLTNVARHAEASAVRIEFDDAGEWWTLRVSDDGVGISSDASSQASALGLLGIRERLDMLGGAFTVGPAPDGGTTAVAAIPVRRGAS